MTDNPLRAEPTEVALLVEPSVEVLAASRSGRINHEETR